MGRDFCSEGLLSVATRMRDSKPALVEPVPGQTSIRQPLLWGLGLLLWHPAGASGPCWESSKCQDLASEAGVSGGHKREEAAGGNPPPASLPAVPPSRREEEQGTGLEREEGKRSYSMEHFRWGKPVGRKRRPIKVYPNGVEEESAESFPLEFRRELALGGTGAPPEEGEAEHAPLKDKRYGGFMTSEHSQTPLVTLFKNAIIKSAYKKGQ
ncbi:PREDICTED: pro-opiomelanocortin [Fulmarus glacialis]|uniref:pro-opiomelanocortin n=1 Tax=Fulmarus glacialis TaxID=30455 RepID=UPI00051C7146|nr:PREDICTED: pro-opiomelanocortin [Fulmarus glacialis]